jgi:flagellar hook assembly protein FlgD
MILQFSPTGVEEEIIGPPRIFSLSQNYPNPFNTSTTIEYSLPEEAVVTIEIYDILGCKIETLVSGRQAAGSHAVVWEAEDVPSGVYFYRIEAGEYSQTQKCVLLK